MSYLGLDIGTSGCKAAIFDENWNCVSCSYQAYPVRSPEPGYAELDSSEVIEKCCDVIRKVVKGSSSSEVRAMAISSQGEAFTPVGENGRYLADAMMSSDCRAADLIDDWSEEFGREELYRITGHSPSAMFTLFKLIWLRRNRPDIWNRGKAFYCFEDLMHYRLGVEPAMGWPLAGRTMLFDIGTHRWNKEILSRIGLTEEQLARPLPSGSIAGVIPDETAYEFGLPAGVKLVCGGHDQTICALGAGAVEPGSAMYATGTVECICPVLADKILSSELQKNNLCCYDYSLPGKYTTVAYSLTGGNILQWFKEQFGQGETETARIYDLLLDNLPDRPTDLLTLPYFTPSGTPFFDTDTPGAILGLRMTTTRYDILKSLLEAVLLEMKLNLELLMESGMKIDKLIATGGGATHDGWLQLKADVLNRPILQTKIKEAGCHGAAALARAADLNVDISEILPATALKCFQPDAARAAIYNRKFAEYKVMYQALKKIYRHGCN